jgi:hypothetical protein
VKTLEIKLGKDEVRNLTQAACELRFANHDSPTFTAMLETLVEDFSWKWDPKKQTAHKEFGPGLSIGLERQGMDDVKLTIKNKETA